MGSRGLVLELATGEPNSLGQPDQASPGTGDT